MAEKILNIFICFIDMKIINTRKIIKHKGTIFILHPRTLKANSDISPIKGCRQYLHIIKGAQKIIKIYATN